MKPVKDTGTQCTSPQSRLRFVIPLAITCSSAVALSITVCVVQQQALALVSFNMEKCSVTSELSVGPVCLQTVQGCDSQVKPLSGAGTVLLCNHYECLFSFPEISIRAFY